MADQLWLGEEKLWWEFLTAEKQGLEGEPDFWRGLEERFGPTCYTAILFRLTRKSFSPEKARSHLAAILAHLEFLSQVLRRPFGLRAALADYFVNIKAISVDPILVEQALLVEKEQGALKDELTGLFNRRFLNSILEKQVAVSNRFDQPFSLIMLDVDNFKVYNDTHGHLAGDQILAELSRILQQTCRAIDYLCRFGGEEFVIVLPQADKDQVFIAAQRHRSAVESHVFPRQSSQPGKNLTISLGTATYPQDAGDAIDLVSRADAALYAAKSAGRNQVWTSGSERRRYPRVPFTAPVDYRYQDSGHDFATGMSQDISLAGMGLKTQNPLEPQRPLELIIHADRDLNVRINGQAVRVLRQEADPRPYQTGVAVSDPFSKDRFTELVERRLGTMH